MQYKALIRCVLEYGGVIWDNYAKSYSNKLETFQRRAARYAYGDHRQKGSVTARLKETTGGNISCTFKKSTGKSGYADQSIQVW